MKNTTESLVSSIKSIDTSLDISCHILKKLGIPEYIFEDILYIPETEEYGIILNGTRLSDGRLMIQISSRIQERTHYLIQVTLQDDGSILIGRNSCDSI